MNLLDRLYEKDDRLLIVDHVGDEEVYFRTFLMGELLGLNRMPIKEFEKQLKEWLGEDAKPLDTPGE